MSPLEQRRLDELWRRLYGGPLDRDEGDIIAIRRELTALAARFERRDAQINALLAMSMFLGIGGVAAILHAFGVAW